MQCAPRERLGRLQTMAAGAIVANDRANMRAVLQTIDDTLRKVVDERRRPEPSRIVAAIMAYDIALADKEPILRNRVAAMSAAIAAISKGGCDGMRSTTGT